MITPNEKMFAEYWKFAYDRQEVFYNKLNDSYPYSNNPILQTYKFCNTYRVLDRVSQFLISNVINTTPILSPQDTIFRVVFFKLFNLPNTWTELEKQFGTITLKNYDFKPFSQFLSKLKNKTAIYNSAYISCANKAFGYDEKHNNHLKLLEKMFFKDNLANQLLNTKTMEKAFQIMVAYPLIGNFMAYQLVTDLAYCEFLPWQENEFTVAGPGSIRGINKCFTQFSSYEDVIVFAYKNQETYFKKLNLPFHYLSNRKLQLIDIQNLFCEFDKYCRVAHPELKSNRTKIKAKYTKTKPQITYKLPTKWDATI